MFPDGVPAVHDNEGPHDWLDALDREPLLDAAFRESLRLCPAITITARVNLSPDTLPQQGGDVDGYTLPAGTVVSIPIQALHRAKAVWGPDANEFRPGRFLDCNSGDADARHLRDKYYMPFLYGGRACIGGRLAALEMKAMLAALLVGAQHTALRGLRFRLTPGCEPAAHGVIPVPKQLSLRIASACD